MKLRIYRTWTWQIACSPMEVIYGGPNPMKLVAHDQLQYFCGDLWVDIEIVEAEKPLHPNESLNRI